MTKTQDQVNIRSFKDAISRKRYYSFEPKDRLSSADFISQQKINIKTLWLNI